MEGYQLSQLNSVRNDPAEILSEFQNPSQGNLTTVYRTRLGKPYVSSEDQMRASDVLSFCGHDVMPMNHPGPCAMGVDPGKPFYVVIGCRTGEEKWQVVKLARVESFNDIFALCKRYNVKSAVIDQLPYEDSARDFQKSCGFRSFLCHYSETHMGGHLWNDTTKIVTANRTDSLDYTHRMFAQSRVNIPARCEEVNLYSKQMAATAKKLERNKKTGVQVFRYVDVGSGGDHYRHAMGYFLMAANPNCIGIANCGYQRPTRVIREYQII
jgi:hypothetical protein